MSAGQSDRHNQICACQNTTNRVFVPVNDRDRTLISRLYNKHTCREVSPGLDAPRVAVSFPNSPSERGEFGKLPATRGASNPGLTEPASMFGFYHMPFR